MTEKKKRLGEVKRHRANCPLGPMDREVKKGIPREGAKKSSKSSIPAHAGRGHWGLKVAPRGDCSGKKGERGGEEGKGR